MFAHSGWFLESLSVMAEQTKIDEMVQRLASVYPNERKDFLKSVAEQHPDDYAAAVEFVRKCSVQPGPAPAPPPPTAGSQGCQDMDGFSWAAFVVLTIIFVSLCALGVAALVGYGLHKDEPCSERLAIYLLVGGPPSPSLEHSPDFYYIFSFN